VLLPRERGAELDELDGRHGPVAQSPTFTQAFSAALPAAWITAGLILEAGSLLPFPTDARPGSFSQDFFEHIALRLRLTGAVCVLFGSLVAFARHHVHAFLDDAIACAPGFAKDLKRACRSAVDQGPPSHLAALILVFVVALAVRLRFLFEPIRYDEALTFNEFASRPLYIGLSFYPDPNNHLFHTLLVRFAYVLFGNHLWAIRLPAFLAGVLVVPATYYLGRLLNNRHAALLSAACVATSLPLIDYSTNARGYTLLTLVFLLCLALAVYVHTTGNGTAMLLFSGLAAIGFYTIPIMLYGFGSIVAWLTLSIAMRAPPTERAPRLTRLLAALVVTGMTTFVLYLAPLLVSGPERVFANRFVAPLHSDSYLSALVTSLAATWRQWNWDLPVPVSAFWLIGFVVAVLFHGKLARVDVPIVLPVILWCIPALLVQRVAPFERVWLFLLPLYFIISCAGLIYIVQAITSTNTATFQRLSPILAAVLALGSGAYLSFNSSISLLNEGVFRDAEPITRAMVGRVDERSSVLTVVPASLPQLQYYFNKFGLDKASLVRGVESSDRVFVIAPSPRDGSLPESLAEHGLTAETWSDPLLTAVYESAAIYELDRHS
jgi:Dolichyl-phosphate-mannose-protein mannosyltransferase